MARAITQETQQLEMDLNEERSRYQNLLTEHLRLEEKYDDLKEEMTSLVSLSLSERSTSTYFFDANYCYFFGKTYVGLFHEDLLKLIFLCDI